MTHYELLKSTESALKMMQANDVCIDNVRHIEVYEQLRRMEREGHKKTFIIAYLCEQYGVSEATLYRVASRMSRNVVM